MDDDRPVPPTLGPGAPDRRRGRQGFPLGAKVGIGVGAACAVAAALACGTLLFGMPRTAPGVSLFGPAATSEAAATAGVATSASAPTAAPGSADGATTRVGPLAGHSFTGDDGSLLELRADGTVAWYQDAARTGPSDPVVVARWSGGEGDVASDLIVSYLDELGGYGVTRSQAAAQQDRAEAAGMDWVAFSIYDQRIENYDQAGGKYPPDAYYFGTFDRATKVMTLGNLRTQQEWYTYREDGTEEAMREAMPSPGDFLDRPYTVTKPFEGYAEGVGEE